MNQEQFVLCILIKPYYDYYNSLLMTFQVNYEIILLYSTNKAYDNIENLLLLESVSSSDSIMHKLVK